MRRHGRGRCNPGETLVGAPGGQTSVTLPHTSSYLVQLVVVVLELAVVFLHLVVQPRLQRVLGQKQFKLVALQIDGLSGGEGRAKRQDDGDSIRRTHHAG